MSLRAKQVTAIVCGFIVAVAMVLLGLWQMNRFQLSVEDIAAERAAMPAVDLAPAVHDDGSVDDVYGRQVKFSGEYLPEYEQVVGTTEARVVTAFKMSDGRHLAVVRGGVDEGDEPAEPPAGPQDVEAVFTASDHAQERPAGSVRLQQLAQEWPSPLVAGYVTLSEADSAAQGLKAVEAELPEQQGTAMHQGYALQWWVFAAAAIAFSVFLARQFRVQEEQRAERIRRRREAQAQLAKAND